MKLVNSYSNRWDGIILEKRKKKITLLAVKFFPYNHES